MGDSNVQTVVLAVVPVLAALAGFWISHHFESQRDEVERANDRANRRRETRRNLLEQLQYALAGVASGYHAAAWRLYADKDRSVAAGKAAFAEEWYRDWQAAMQRVNVLAAQVDDEQLQAAAKAVHISADQLDEVARATDQKALADARSELEDAYTQANDRAGQLIQQLDAEEPVLAKKGRP